MSDEPHSLMADQALLLQASNDSRCKALEDKTGGNASLDNVFDALRMLTFLDHVVSALGVAEAAELDFQGRREKMIDEMETKYAELLAAREAAERQARLTGGPVGIRGGKPMRPGPGGIVRP